MPRHILSSLESSKVSADRAKIIIKNGIIEVQELQELQEFRQ